MGDPCPSCMSQGGHRPGCIYYNQQYQSPGVCPHGSLRRACEVCERDEEITRLRAENERNHEDAERWRETERAGLVCVTAAEHAELERLRAEVDTYRTLSDALRVDLAERTRERDSAERARQQYYDTWQEAAGERDEAQADRDDEHRTALDMREIVDHWAQKHDALQARIAALTSPAAVESMARLLYAIDGARPPWHEDTHRKRLSLIGAERLLQAIQALLTAPREGT